MNTPNRHIRYRRSVYRRNRIKVITVTTVCVIATLALIFLVVGNLLGNKVDENSHTNSGNMDSGTEAPSVNVKQVNAYPVALSEEGSSLSTRLTRVSNNGYSEVCFNMDTQSGSLLYVSDIAVSLGKQGSATDLRSLENIVDTFKSHELYSIGVTHISDYISDDDLVRSAAIGYHAARIAEALRAGIDDILIYVGELPTERYGELISLANEIRRLSASGNIGLSLPVSILSGDSNAKLIDDLFEAFDYLAADLSVSEDTETDTAEQIESELEKGLLFYLLRYKMRALIPNTSDTSLSQRISDVLNNRNIQNRQVMP